MSKLSEFMFGSEESRAKGKETLKDMRPRYERPKVGGASAPKVTRGEKMANPTIGGGYTTSSVSRSEMDRMSERMRLKREGEARSRKVDAQTRKVADTALNTARKPDPVPKNPNNGLGSAKERLDFKFVRGGVGVQAYNTDRAPGFGGKLDRSAPKPKAKPADKPKAAAPKPKAKPSAPAAKGVTFKGNWKGAAPTAMQARGGAKLKESAGQRMQRMMRDRGVGGR